jgi:sulfite exporter TauE/SafE
MDKGKALNNLLLISGLFGILLLGLVFDLGINSLATRNAETGTMSATLIWMFSLLELLLMVGIVGLTWLAVSSGGFSRWVSVVYLVVGLIVLYTNPVLYVTEMPDSLYVVVEFLIPGSMLYQAGGFAAAFGLVSLFFWKSAKEDSTEETELPEESV